MPQVTLAVTGCRHSVQVEGRTLLVQLLREQAVLTGTRAGCDTGQWGAAMEAALDRDFSAAVWGASKPRRMAFTATFTPVLLTGHT